MIDGLDSHQIPYEEFDDLSGFYEQLNQEQPLVTDFYAEPDGSSAEVLKLSDYDERRGLRAEEVSQLTKDILDDLNKAA